MADYTLSAKITADIKGFVSNINTVTKKAESMAEKLSSSMQPVKTAAASAKDAGSKSKSAVSTADESPIGTMSVLAALSLLAGGYVVVRKRKKEEI